MKNIIIIVLVVGLLGLGFYAFTRKETSSEIIDNTDVPGEIIKTPVVETNGESGTLTSKTETIIGKSLEGRDIVAYHFGAGNKEVLFVSDSHGGYAWNTALLANQVMEYFKTNPTEIASNLKVTVIPVLNPDGLFKVVGKETAQFSPADVVASKDIQVAGRFNANNVDINRNFDCQWQANGTWQNTPVSGGSRAFSEPESQAVKSYVEAHPLAAVVAWYSAAGGVYASNCNTGVLPKTTLLTNVYAKASGYTPYESFDFYETTGDMVNWFAKKGIPAISVLLTNHTDTEWAKNRAGIKALLDFVAIN
ncbi:MAG: M14 family metallopeptidase [bacterium]|nr:M14 family metallopeptidase [bacterium]